MTGRDTSQWQHRAEKLGRGEPAAGYLFAVAIVLTVLSIPMFLGAIWLSGSLAGKLGGTGGVFASLAFVAAFVGAIIASG